MPKKRKQSSISSVVIVHDAPLTRLGIRTACEKHGIAIEGEGKSIKDGLKQFLRKKTATIILELLCETDHGAPLLWPIDTVLETQGNAKILLFSRYNNIGIIKDLYDRGIRGYLPHSVDTTTLCKALDTISSGTKFYLPGIAEKLLQYDHTQEPGDNDPSEALPQALLDVFLLSIQGHDTKNIANKLNIHPKSVHNRRAEINVRLGGVDRYTWPWIARKYGLIPLKEWGL
ncbi:MAG: hypothetical protein ACR2QC_02865 [Gammaproteobacteria bacterium]